MIKQTDRGATWVDYVPRWIRVGAPILIALLGLSGFMLGFGEGHGKSAARLDAQDARSERMERERDTERVTVALLRVELAELRGTVNAIARALGVMPAQPAMPPTGPQIREAP